MTVWVSIPNRKGTYHTDEDCGYLNRASKTRVDDIETLNDELTECKVCQGIAPGRNSESHKMRNKLLEMDPEVRV